MYLSALKLFQFRNLQETKLQFSPDLNIVRGRNGQGKSNLLEAIYLLGSGRSFRTSSISEVVRWGAEAASIFGVVEEQLGPSELGLVVKAGRRELFVNQQRAESLEKYIGKVATVTFTPADIELVRGEPEIRRTYVDRLLLSVNPNATTLLLAYHKALKSKNALLREETPRADEIAPWNEILAENGAAIMRGRRELVERLSSQLSTAYASFAEEELQINCRMLESIELRGELSKETFLEILRTSYFRELSSRRALIGPHRDDLIIEMNEKSARSFASQGQSRSIVLALRLAAIEMVEQQRGESPIVMLDDVDAELDEPRAAAFFAVMLSKPRQVFVTGTELTKLVEKVAGRGALFDCKNGTFYSK